MALPGRFTCRFTDEGTGACLETRIEGSASYAAERLAGSGGHALLTVPLIRPGTTHVLELKESSGAPGEGN